VNIVDIAEKIATEHSLTRSTSKTLVEGVLAQIVEGIMAGDEVSLPQFGKFKVKSVAARTGRNPQTGKEIQIPASRKLTFSPAKSVKDALAGV
jgi:DNA-binding protein HU-beta